MTPVLYMNTSVRAACPPVKMMYTHGTRGHRDPNEAVREGGRGDGPRRPLASWPPLASQVGALPQPAGRRVQARPRRRAASWPPLAFPVGASLQCGPASLQPCECARRQEGTLSPPPSACEVSEQRIRWRVCIVVACENAGGLPGMTPTSSLGRGWFRKIPYRTPSLRLRGRV